LRNGSISSFEALQAQDYERRSQRQLQQLRTSQLQTSVALVRAIGGGWE
jgi:multidrug efflux system outer membrane protein